MALIAFQAARLPARVDSTGDLVLLEDQDRSLWDQKLVGLGFRHFSASAEGTEISPYHVQAAIAAVYAGAQQTTSINWPAILSLYDQLMEISPSPVVALNRAAALSKVHGAQAALTALRPLLEDRSLRNYYLLPAVQGGLMLDLGNREGATDCFRKALGRPCSEPEKRFLRRKLAECAGPDLLLREPTVHEAQASRTGNLSHQKQHVSNSNIRQAELRQKNHGDEESKME